MCVCVCTCRVRMSPSGSVLVWPFLFLWESLVSFLTTGPQPSQLQFSWITDWTNGLGSHRSFAAEPFSVSAFPFNEWRCCCFFSSSFFLCNIPALSFTPSLHTYTISLGVCAPTISVSASLLSTPKSHSITMLILDHPLSLSPSLFFPDSLATSVVWEHSEGWRERCEEMTWLVF